MKFNVKCLVNSVNSNALPEADGSVKVIEVTNPNAQLSSLRAKAGLAFRLSLGGFSLLYKGERAATVDLSNERRKLSECGLQENDCIVLVSKRVKEANGCELPDAEGSPPAPTQTATTTTTAAGGVVAATASAAAVEAEADTEQPLLKIPRTEASAERNHHREEDPSLQTDNDDAEEVEEMEEMEEDGEVDLDLNVVAVSALLGDSADAAAGELYSHLLEVVPDLVELRREFLSNPQAVMERIQREDPTLFQLITAHQEAFVGLINNEEAIATIQGDRDLGEGDDDEELDEETMAHLLGLLAGGTNGLEDDSDSEADDGDANSEEGHVELGLGDLAALQDGGDGGKEAKARILAFPPTEEDEQKIQQLTQLGFPYDVCKVAFYRSHRSLERAANLLFEHPPQL